MQGHPEAPRLWKQHADSILRDCGLTPTTHEPCLYSGLIEGDRVLFMRQVDDFAVAVPSERIANILFDLIDDKLTFPLKRMGLVDLFNGVSITQTRDWIKLSVKTYLERIMEKHRSTWMKTDATPDTPTPLPARRTFMRDFLSAVGSDDEKAQTKLAKEMGFGFRNGIGEIIYAMTTCRPDVSYGVVRASQYSVKPVPIHYHGVRHMLKYLWHTRDDGIYCFSTVYCTYLSIYLGM